MERTAPPSWSQEGTRMASQPMLNFLAAIRNHRDLSSLSEEQRTWLMDLTAQQLQFATTDLPFDGVRRALDVMSKLPDRPKGENPGEGTSNLADSPVFPEVAAGRYAVESDEGELRFYRVYRGTRNVNYVKVYVQHGPDESPMFHAAALSVMEKILAFGPRKAAIRYGNEIGRCSNCGRRLTNRISRELGIGPICGGRMFGDEFDVEINDAKIRLTDRGLDWREEV